MSSPLVGFCGSCGCQPCNCVYQVINNPPGPNVTFSAANINLSGIGVYDSQSGNTFQFRGVASANAFLSVALDATNHSILFTFDVTGVANALPQATPTQRGVGETAIDAEAQAKASTTVFVTPSNFAAMAASTTFAGFTAYATNAQAITGTSATLALTPANLTAVLAQTGTTEVFADIVARAGATPEFIGQFAAEQDTQTAYLGNALSVGAWLPLLVFGTTNDAGSSNTTVADTGNMIWDGGGIGAFQFDGVTITLISGSELTIDTGCEFNLINGSILLINNGTVPANSVLTTSGTAGHVSSSLINTFISTANIQTGYTAFVAPATIRTLNTGTATLQQVAQCLGTVIEDLKAGKYLSA